MAPFADPNVPREVTTPLLCVAGTADAVTSTPAMERFAGRLKTGRALVLTGALHEDI
jgi:lysophospholipase